jgi:hypothetical protein
MALLYFRYAIAKRISERIKKLKSIGKYPYLAGMGIQKRVDRLTYFSGIVLYSYGFFYLIFGMFLFALTKQG